MRKSAQVVIVGGGIIGCATAAELAQAGADVVLLERREIAHGASGRNHGLIFYPQNVLTEDLYRVSHGMYTELAEGQIDIQLDPQPRNFIILVAEEHEWGPAEAEAMACRQGGIPVEKLDRKQLREAEPNLSQDLLGGWLINDGYRLDPAALTLALALKARGSGAEINTHVEAKQLLAKNGKATGVATDDGVIAAEVVIDAAGPWASKVSRSLGLDLPVLGARGWLLLTKAMEQITNHLLESSGWHLLAGDPGPELISVGDFGREGRSPDAGRERRSPDAGRGEVSSVLAGRGEGSSVLAGRGEGSSVLTGRGEGSSADAGRAERSSVGDSGQGEGDLGIREERPVVDSGGGEAPSVGDSARAEEAHRGDVGLLVQQNQTGHVLLGGSRLATVREDPEGFEVTREIARRAVKVLPRLQRAPLEAVWSGVRPMTFDGLPLIGWMPALEGLFVATGHGGQGIMLGGGTGRLAAQMILGIKTFMDPFVFRPDR